MLTQTGHCAWGLSSGSGVRMCLPHSPGRRESERERERERDRKETDNRCTGRERLGEVTVVLSPTYPNLLHPSALFFFLLAAFCFSLRDRETAKERKWQKEWPKREEESSCMKKAGIRERATPPSLASLRATVLVLSFLSLLCLCLSLSLRPYWGRERETERERTETE